ncbi:Leucine-, isoleucine-, valine-, threonine-, and alanine-binding protein precursor (plasmid) [Variovorax sp. SRS16]|uniref:ABC transporter substrate-binding protein n=1 Tax=Variovorax sp. SRS16 TaxID=282217 RepID=UPI00131644C7|nr:ABC transporter substrate-binding protein [Variovorax sp. SRS16]VTU45352.1 Leucine-, isoleucine-, valine-, threonine-, and alanine-binding protein precursor [Variovorax sp. SRS16]
MNLETFGRTIVLAFGLTVSLFKGANAETLKIGVIAPLTGGGAPWGMAAAEAPKILAAEINAKGGLDVGGKKYQIEVIAYDDQYKAADSVAAYNRLLNQDGVKYMIVQTSTAALALKQNVEDDKVLALTAAATSKAFDANTKYMFRIVSPPSDYISALIPWVKEHYKGARIAVLNPNDETGWDQKQISEKVFKKSGYEILTNDLYERSQKDFQPIFTKIIDMKPDVIDLGSTPPSTAGLMIRQARELGYKGLFLKTGGAGPKEIVAGAGSEAAAGMISMLYIDPTNDGYRRIAAAYKKSVGQEPNEMLGPLYDGVNVLLQAIQKAGDVRDTAKVAAAFAQALPMKSVQGDMLTLGGKATIGVDQQVMSVTYVGEIKNGQPVVVGKVK